MDQEIIDSLLFKIKNSALDFDKSHEILRIAAKLLDESKIFFETRSVLLAFKPKSVPNLVLSLDMKKAIHDYYGSEDDIEYVITPIRRNKNKELNDQMPVSFLFTKEMYCYQDHEPNTETRIASRLLSGLQIEKDDVDYLLELNEYLPKLNSALIMNQHEILKSSLNINIALSFLDNKIVNMHDSITNTINIKTDQINQKTEELNQRILKFMEIVKRDSAFGDSIFNPLVLPNVDHTVKEVSELKMIATFDDFYDICGKKEVINIDSNVNLTVFKFNYENSNFANPLGTPCCYYCVNHNDISYWFLMIAKDDTNTGIEHKDLPLIDLISDSVGLESIGYKFVNTSLVSASLLQKRMVDIGFASGKFGSIERKYYTTNEKFRNAIEAISVKKLSGSKFKEVIDFAVDRVKHAMKSLNLEVKSSYYYSSLMMANKYSRATVLGAKIENVSLDTERGREIAAVLNKLPKEFSKTISSCVMSCVVNRDQRNNMMHGSMVKYKNRIFTAPCGATFNRLAQYLEHPCSIRSRSIGIIDDVDAVMSIQNDHFSIIDCSSRCNDCGRVYNTLLECNLCSLFCKMIKFGAVREKDFKIQEDKITAIYGDFTNVKPKLLTSNYGKYST